MSKNFFTYILIVFVFIFPLLLSAEVKFPSNPNVPAIGPGTTPGVNGSSPGISGIIHNPFNCRGVQDEQCTFIDLLTSILNNIVIPIASVGVVIYIIYAGFTYVLAQGNPGKIEEAHKRLLWSLVGAGILLGAAGISIVVQNTVHSLIR